MSENAYMLINNEEVEERINYERALATAYDGMPDWYKTKTNLKNLNLTDTIAPPFVSSAYSMVTEWRGFQSFYLWILPFPIRDEKTLATAFAALQDDDRTWEHFNSLNLTDDNAKATAFAALQDNDRTWDHFGRLNLTDDNAKATAFAALQDKNNQTWENFNSLNLTDDNARATAFAALRISALTWEHFQELREILNNNQEALARAFVALSSSPAIWLTWQRFVELKLTEEKAKAIAFSGLWKNDKTWENAQKLELTDDESKVIVFKGFNQDENATYENYRSLKLTSWQTKAEAFCSLNDKYKTARNFKKEFGTTSRFHIGGGVTLGILTASALVLLFLHIFCPPAAVIIDGALATVGIGGGTAAIVVPVTVGGIGLGSGALSGMLFHKRFVFPEASNDVKEQIQQRNQSPLLAIENTEDFQTNDEQNQSKNLNDQDLPVKQIRKSKSQEFQGQNKPKSILNGLVPGTTAKSDDFKYRPLSRSKSQNYIRRTIDRR